ncbi:MAG: HNH endonuclease [Deltaproteobacteria bacterium]|jgi:DNA repair exonuclease SbcCD ATPase subunit|nr:HNH endonuclease [Deltaproteobacteria bacterium]
MPGFPPQTKVLIWARQDGHCGLCGHKFQGEPERYHHLLRQADGGSMTMDNGVLLCETCHSQVHDHSRFREPVYVYQREFPHAKWDQGYKYQTQIDNLNNKIKSCRDLRFDLEKYGQDIRNILLDTQAQLKNLRLSSEDYQNIKDQINTEFNVINEFQRKRHEHYEHECETNRRELTEKVHQATNLAQNSHDWKEARQYLISVQQSFKGRKLKKEVSQSLYAELQKAFQVLGDRQEASRREYENLCQANRASLTEKVHQAKDLAQNSRDWKEARQYLIAVQQSFKSLKLKKEDNQALYAELQSAFNLLSQRQEASFREYETACAQNYDFIRDFVNKAVNLVNYGSDLKEAAEALKIARSRLFESQPFKKEKREELKNALTKANDQLSQRFADARDRREREFQQKQEHFREMTREKIHRLEEKADRIKNSIYNDRESLQFQRDKHSNVRPGPREYEIKSSISDKINDIENRINEKSSVLSDLKHTIMLLRDKL